MGYFSLSSLRQQATSTSSRQQPSCDHVLSQNTCRKCPKTSPTCSPGNKVNNGVFCDHCCGGERHRRTAMLVETSRRRLGCKGSRNKNLLLLLSLAGFVALLTSQSSSPAEAFRVTADAPLSGAGSRSISCRWDGELHQSESERNRDSSSDSSDSSSSSRSSRGEFLQDHALGVGLALTTGLSYETPPGNALFGEGETAV